MASLLHPGLSLWPTFHGLEILTKSSVFNQYERKEFTKTGSSRRLNKVINSKIMVLNRYSIKNYISELGYIC